MGDKRHSQIEQKDLVCGHAVVTGNGGAFADSWTQAKLESFYSVFLDACGHAPEWVFLLPARIPFPLFLLVKLKIGSIMSGPVARTSYPIGGGRMWVCLLAQMIHCVTEAVMGDGTSQILQMGP